MEQKVRWGIAGLGKIAQRFAADLTGHAQNSELYAVAARDPQRAEQFASTYHGQCHYGSYQELAQDPNVDAVYVATLNPFHRSMTELFLRHGKHVLVEKPAFTNIKDWDEMSQLAAEKGLLLVEAMKSVVFPAYRSLRQFIHEKQLTIDAVEAAFGYHNPFDPQQRIFAPTLSGGATLDVGVYPLWLYADLCHLIQAPITQPSATYCHDYPDSKVDDHAEFLFSGAFSGKIAGSLSRDLPRAAIIKGPDLEVTIHEKWWNPRTIDIVYQGKAQQLTTPTRGGGFEYEIEHVASLILNGQTRSDVIPAAISRQAIAIMENALQENGFSYLAHPDQAGFK